jgi:hypothetical protein
MGTAKVYCELRDAQVTHRADVQESTARPAYGLVRRTQTTSKRKRFMSDAWRRLLAAWLRSPADAPFRRLPYL